MKKSRHRGLLLPVLLLAACLAGVQEHSVAQEQSVAPGINDAFLKDDVEQWVKRFETETRSIFKHRRDIVEQLNLRQGMAVADIGAGTGFFSVLMSRRVGNSGIVYAVDISEALIGHIKKTAAEQSITNIKTVVCDDKSCRLPEESVDAVFICDTYHHFEYPEHTMKSIHASLKPEGILLVVDFERVKGISSKWALDHVRCGKGTTTDEILDAGFDLLEEIQIPGMADQYLLKFKKRG